MQWIENFKEKNSGLVNVNTVCYLYNVFFLLVHSILEFAYISACNVEMCILNAASILLYILIFWLIYTQHVKLCFNLIILEISVFSLLAIIFTGDNSGYSLYCISIIPSTCLYNYYERILLKESKQEAISVNAYMTITVLLFIVEKIISAIEKPLQPITEYVQIERTIGYINSIVLLLAVLIGSFILLIIVIYNSEKLERILEETEYIAKHDPLTGLKNRASLENFVNRLVKDGRPYAVIMGDIDKFKMVNDEWGHDCGDYVLKEVSKIIKECVRKDDRVYRWGGEEIFLILPGADVGVATLRAESIRTSIEAYSFEYNGKPIQITMTFGVCESAGRSFEEIEKEADEHLYYGKSHGRNRVIR